MLAVHPEDLVAEMKRRAPTLVLCGEERPYGCDEAVRWAEFRPYEEPEVVWVDGRAERFPGLAALRTCSGSWTASPWGPPAAGSGESRPGDLPRHARRIITDRCSSGDRGTERP